MTRSRRLVALVFAALLLVFIVPTAAFGQATRTWVSGVGDDANPCSRTAPCKTFAGSISKTAAGGEINVLDPGGFGGVTITKSLTIKAHGVTAGVLVAQTNAIVINAGANDKVTLVGLDINGIGTGAQTSLTGVKVLSAKSVHILDSEVQRFKAGIAVVPTSAQTRVLVKNSHIHDNGVGVITAPGSSANTFATTTLRHNDISENTCGVVSSSFGANASTPNADIDCGAATSATGLNKVVPVRLFHNGVNDNSTGVFVRGSNGQAEMAWNDITGNAAFALRRIDSGVLRTSTPGSNYINNNGATDTTNATAPLG